MPRLCSHCGVRFESDVRFCPHDGAATYWIRAEQELIGHVLDDRYTLTELLGHGGMGAVFRARQHSMDRDVAVKVMLREMSGNDSAVKRFLLEAKTASRLHNPHTVTVFDFGQTRDGMLYLSMELLSGLTLSKELEVLGSPMDPVRAVGIVDQVLDSLAEAHAQGIVHRDIKPDNVFLMDVGGGRDFVKVLDFGIAKFLGDDSGLTVPGTGFGTPSYMSPEQARGAVVDPRSDLYSVGAMLFEMLTLRPPFLAKDPLALVMMKVSSPPPRPSDLNPEVRLPRALEEAVLALLAVCPEHRPPDAGSAKEQLALAMAGPAGEPRDGPATDGTATLTLGPLAGVPPEGSPGGTSTGTASGPTFDSVLPTSGERFRRSLAFRLGLTLLVATMGVGGVVLTLVHAGSASDGTRGSPEALVAVASVDASEADRDLPLTDRDNPSGDDPASAPESGPGVAALHGDTWDEEVPRELSRVRGPADGPRRNPAGTGVFQPKAAGPARAPEASSPALRRLKRGAEAEPAARTRLKR